MPPALRLGPRAAPDPDLLAAVTALWNLGAIRQATDLGGTYNLNLRVETAQGVYVVRVHRPWVRPARLTFVHQTRRALQAAGLPVVPPLATSDGSTFALLAGRLVEIEPLVAADAVADTWERYRPAFALLARLHNELIRVVSPDAYVPPRVSNYGTPPELLTLTRAVTRQVARVPQAAAVAAAATGLLEALRAEWAATGRLLPTGPIHGDYGGANVLFAGEAIVAVLDFDFLAIRERVYDLGYSLYWLFRRLEPDSAPADLPWSRVRALLAAYDEAAVHPLMPAERRALPAEIARVPLYWVAETRHLPNAAGALPPLAPGVAFARALYDAREPIATALAAGS